MEEGESRKRCVWKKEKVESDVYGRRLKKKVMCLEEGESRK